MNGVIRVGDRNTGDGVVVSGSTSIFFDGLGVARKGDPVKCRRHGKTSISEGDSMFLDDGIPVAFHGHACACGCTLITSLPDAATG